MTDHNEAMRLADLMDAMDYEDTRKAAALLRQQAERIAELEKEGASLKEVMSFGAWSEYLACKAERDQLRAEVERLRAPLSEEQIWFLTNEGMLNAAGGIYESSVIEFARAIERAHVAPEKGGA